ncbi:MAG: acyl-CoA dehydrogenase family protein, partial [Parvularcula sp.]|nr:acyl-CoA dehydrogenase family protein [Parvularcula sp.]
MLRPFENEERAEFRRTVRSFVAKEVMPHAAAWDEAGAVPGALHRQAAELGVFGFGVPEEFGGLGFDDAFMRAIWAEELAMCGAGGVGAALGARSISIDPIRRFAMPELRDKYVPDIVAGRINASLAITEPSGGSDVANLKTTAQRTDGHWRLNGQKTFVTGGMSSEVFVVAARTGGPGLGGVSLFLVEEDREGFTRAPLEKKMGWWCSDQATLFFDDVMVPAEHLIGPENAGFLAIMENFNLERLSLIAGCLGAARACLEDATVWARERETFGKPLIKHQVIRHKLVDMSTRIDALSAMTDSLCWAINSGPMPVAEISKTKVLGSKTLEFCASEAMQVLGGAGYLRGGRVERIYREVKVMAIGGGSEE